MHKAITRSVVSEADALAALDVLVAELAETRAEADKLREYLKLANTTAERRGARAVAAEARAEEHRIEADCAMRDFDGLELNAGIMREALERIAAKRPNQSFDPWAVEVARAALAAVEDTGEASAQTADAGGETP